MAGENNHAEEGLAYGGRGKGAVSIFFSRCNNKLQTTNDREGKKQERYFSLPKWRKPGELPSSQPMPRGGKGIRRSTKRKRKKKVHGRGGDRESLEGKKSAERLRTHLPCGERKQKKKQR